MSMPVLSIGSFFTIPASEHLSPTAAKTISTVIIAVCIGVIVAALYNFYVRRVPGGVVRLLLSRGALSPETALTAEELGLLDKPFSLWELLRGSSLRHIVSTVSHAEAATDGEAAQSADADTDGQDAVQSTDAPQAAQEEKAPEKSSASEQALDADTRFYIPKDKKERAEIRFDQKGNGVVSLVITCALSLVLGVVLIKLIPVVLAIAANFF